MNNVNFVYCEAWMSFSNRFLHLRKEHGLTQQQMAERTQLHLTQVRRYEAGEAQPSLDAIKKIAQAFHISTDYLIFESNEREPADDLKLQFEAVSRMPEDEKRIVKALLDGMIVKHQTKQLVHGLSS